MALSGATIGLGQYYTESSCASQDNCPSNTSADLTLKRYDTSPSFRVEISDCDGALDLTDQNLIVEASMWFSTKLKKNISTSDTVVQFADKVGFNQILVGDKLIFQNVRKPETMTVVSIDESTNDITVSRADIPSSWKKGSEIKVYRIKDASASIDTVTGDIIDETGATLTDQVIETDLVYNWDVNDTILPGCYYFEFNLVKLNPPIDNVFTNYKILLEYPIGNTPMFVTPQMMLLSTTFNYSWCSFIVNPVISNEYDYFSIYNPEGVISINPPEDGTGTITITSEFINDGISITPIYDTGDSISTISITDESGGQVQSIQPGLTIYTKGEIINEGLVVGSFTSGGGDTPLIVTFNNRATKAIVEAVLQNIVFVNLSSAPSLATRKFTYQMVDGNGVFYDLTSFYLAIDSLPPVEDLEGVEWTRKFPCQNGFLIKINP